MTKNINIHYNNYNDYNKNNDSNDYNDNNSNNENNLFGCSDQFEASPTILLLPLDQTLPVLGVKVGRLAEHLTSAILILEYDCLCVCPSQKKPMAYKLSNN